MIKNKVLMCVTKLREEEKLIHEELQSRSCNVRVVLDSESIPFINDNYNIPEVAIIRSMSQSSAVTKAQMIDAAKVQVINSIDAIMTCTNKLAQSIKFAQARIPQPAFKMASNSEEVRNGFSLFGKTFVIKPVSSSWGRGIVRIVDENCLESWLAARESIDVKEQHFPILMQEYIDKENFDIRVMIVGKNPIVAFKRVSDNWKTNTHLGASVVPTEINQEINELVTLVVSAVGEGIYGLDLMFDREKNKYLVCEINQNPEFARSSKIHGINVASHIAKYVVSRSNT